MKATLQKPDITVKYAMVNAQTRIPMVVDGSVDLECGSRTNTLARQQQVDFSGTYLSDRNPTSHVEIEQDKGIRGPSWKVDCRGRRHDEGEGVKALVSRQGERRQLVVVKDYAEGIAILEAKKADAFATDDIVLFGLLTKSARKKDLEVVGRLLTYDPYGVMLGATIRLPLGREPGTRACLPLRRGGKTLRQVV